MGGWSSTAGGRARVQSDMLWLRVGALNGHGSVAEAVLGGMTELIGDGWFAGMLLFEAAFCLKLFLPLEGTGPEARVS